MTGQTSQNHQLACFGFVFFDGGGILFSVCPSGRPSVNTYFARRDTSVISEGISLILATNTHHVSRYRWKGFQGQRSKVKVMTN